MSTDVETRLHAALTELRETTAYNPDLIADLFILTIERIAELNAVLQSRVLQQNSVQQEQVKTLQQKQHALANHVQGLELRMLEIIEVIAPETLRRDP